MDYKENASEIFQRVIEGTQKGHTYEVREICKYAISITNLDRAVILYVESNGLRLVKAFAVNMEYKWSYHSSVGNLIKVIIRHLEGKS
jgi:hypothetical protein